jgi:hypothetical protein
VPPWQKAAGTSSFTYVPATADYLAAASAQGAPRVFRPAAGSATLHFVDAPANTLYLLLGEPAPEGETPGRTPETRAKETIDNDVEALALELLIDG